MRRKRIKMLATLEIDKITINKKLNSMSTLTTKVAIKVGMKPKNAHLFHSDKKYVKAKLNVDMTPRAIANQGKAFGRNCVMKTPSKK